MGLTSAPSLVIGSCDHLENAPVAPTDLSEFGSALDFQIRKHRDLPRALCRQLKTASGIGIDPKTLWYWRNGRKEPSTASSFKVLAFLEQRYGLPEGYFRAMLGRKTRAVNKRPIRGVSRAEQRRLSWHLPDDFSDRPLKERKEILEWVRSVIVTGTTEYRKYQASMMKHRYAVRFSCRPNDNPDESLRAARLRTVLAPKALREELDDLIRFKTSVLTPLGLQRNGVWGDETASQKIEHFGLLFGALVASPESNLKGRGVDLSSLTFAMLVFPSVWDFYLNWRQKRRGFFTAWEVDMLVTGMAFTRVTTGWLRQSPALAERLIPIDGLISNTDVLNAKADWNGACEAFHKYAATRSKEIKRVARVHRDPFEPILPVLEAAKPLSEYKKIADEIVRLMPDEKRYPSSAAESMRALLMIRLGLHLGVRQKNLRQLLCKRRGEPPSSDKHLNDQKRGELRWSNKDNGWEVVIPAIAFKNDKSSFFGNKPFRLLLPDLAGLYGYIETYIQKHRPRLLKSAADPGTFFVKSTKKKTASAAYCQTSFYDAWRLTIQRFGIYNPYTGRGAIPGLLPHGPHNVRDVLATHILKLTGSFEQASYAIQDTPDIVAKHYGRFLPQDKTALAAGILNRVWEAA